MNDTRLATEVKGRLDEARIDAFRRGYDAACRDIEADMSSARRTRRSEIAAACLLTIGVMSVIFIAVSVYYGGLPW